MNLAKPIIKAHVNPLVLWIWIGVHVILIGTIIALIPNMKPQRGAPVKDKDRALTEAEHRGAVGVGGD